LARYASIDLLKTTQSGWSDFHDSRFTTLPDTQERILATSVNATWAYCEPAYCAPKIDYADVFLRVQAAIMKTFYGPTDTGEFSPGVQASLFKMATASIAAAPEIARITLNLPNLHFLPANLPVFARNGITFEHDVYVPSTEPHGIISATVERPGLAKL
jgi:urate oxidase